ncbi:MAG: bifunctional hydroxymethylpyrimidine kinase/phosphomethylpyrimidine kinase [Pseudomonadota bacterium]
MTRPIALTIAGSDSSGGAGIQADLKAFGAFKVYGASVLTALTAQNTRGVHAIHPVPAAFVAAQLSAVLDDLDVGAIKIGMLAQAPIIKGIAEGLRDKAKAPIVLDPVMVATSGDVLIDEAAIAALQSDLLFQAHLITPNLPEAARLLTTDPATSTDEMVSQAEALRDRHNTNVLLKGGHSAWGEDVVDVLAKRDGRTVQFTSVRLGTTHTHGTGCTLSAAIAAGLAHGKPLDASVADAKRYLFAALEAGQRLRVGGGKGPVDHLIDWTPDA